MINHNFWNQTLNISQSKHNAFTVTVFFKSILGQNCHINCHDLQMTGPKYLKLGILALQYINRKHVEDKEYVLITYDLVSV